MREHFDVWSEAQTYREAAVHLVLSAFLNRVVNGRGSITREYALGRGRVDLAISWPLPDGSRQRFALEVKVIAPQRSAETVRRDGLKQLQAYGDRLDATEAHLLIADRRPGRTWDERITHVWLSADDLEPHAGLRTVGYRRNEEARRHPVRQPRDDGRRLPPQSPVGP